MMSKKERKLSRKPKKPSLAILGVTPGYKGGESGRDYRVRETDRRVRKRLKKYI